MKLKRLYIGDMGIYRNALMEDISPNIVVIGGLNRAGKTTLLEILRHLVYGIPKNLRDAMVEYNLESDFTDETNQNFTVRINGLKEPQITSNKEKISLTGAQLYKNVDRFTYSKLFTLTLDELKKSNMKEEEEKIKAILMGAGLNDIVQIPKLLSSFSKEKEKIGGKQCSPKIKQLKPHYEKLIKAIEDKDYALKLVEDYKDASLKQKDVEKEIEKCEKEIKEIEDNLTILDILRANYDYYKEKIQYQIALEQYDTEEEYKEFEAYPSLDRLEELYKEYEKALQRYEKAKENTTATINYKKIYESRESLRQFDRKQSGLKEKLQNYYLQKRQLRSEKETLEHKMNSLNHEWKGDFSKLDNINCSLIEEDKLLTLVEKIKDNEEQLNKINWELNEQEGRQEEIQGELKKLKSSDLGAVMNMYLIIAILVFLAGVGLYTFNKLLGGSAAIVGVVLASLYAVSKYYSVNGISTRKKVLEIEANSVENKINSINSRAEDIYSTIKDLYSALESYKRQLVLQRDMSAASIYTFYKGVQDLKINIVNYDNKARRLEELKKEAFSELLSLKIMLQEFYMEISFSEDNLLEHYEALFNYLEKILINLKEAEDLNSLERGYVEIKDKILGILTLEEKQGNISDKLNIKIQRYKEFLEYKNIKSKLELSHKTIVNNLSSQRFVSSAARSGLLKEEVNKNYDSLFEDFSSIEDINKQYSYLENKEAETYDRLKVLEESNQSLKLTLDNLRTSEKIQEAQRLIDEGRSNLEPLAFKYAVFSAAEYILEKVQKNFIDSAKDSLLSGASSILSKITGGEYKTILPGDNLLMSDFTTITEDDREQASYEVLSRGTSEQVFLSVRFNRIKEMEAKLPVILDDPFVNFDRGHILNTMGVISEISSSNQIFILTCHPEVVRLSQEKFHNVQFWKLNKGRFEPSKGENLAAYLESNN